MHIKRVKRRCSVRGCRSTDTFTISQSREVGNSVIICKKCLAEALEAVENHENGVVVEPQHKGVPSLFFIGAANTAVEEKKVPEETIQPAEPTDDGVDAPPADAPKFICPLCGQVCKTELGLQKHIAAKHTDES